MSFKPEYPILPPLGNSSERKWRREKIARQNRKREAKIKAAEAKAERKLAEDMPQKPRITVMQAEDPGNGVVPLAEDIKKFRHHLDRASRYQSRISALQKLSQGLFNFYSGLEPEDFTKMSASLYKIVTKPVSYRNVRGVTAADPDKIDDPKLAKEIRDKRKKDAQARLQAMRVILDVINGTMERIAALRAAQRSDELLHLERLLLGFLDGLPPDAFTKLSKRMVAMVRNKSGDTLDRIRAGELLVKQIMRTLKTIVDVQQGAPSDQLDDGDPRVIQAEQELLEMEKEVEGQ